MSGICLFKRVNVTILPTRVNVTILLDKWCGFYLIERNTQFSYNITLFNELCVHNNIIRLINLGL